MTHSMRIQSPCAASEHNFREGSDDQSDQKKRDDAVPDICLNSPPFPPQTKAGWRGEVPLCRHLIRVHRLPQL